MKLDQAIRAAVFDARRRDAANLREVCDTMRFKLGWNYAKSLDAAMKSEPSLTADEWEELMMACDKT